MRDFAPRAGAVESTAGLLKIMDDFAGLRAGGTPAIAEGGYRVLHAVGARPRPSRAAAISHLTGTPMRMRGFLAALFAGSLGLAVLAGPATCPSCDGSLAGDQLDATRSMSRLSYTRGYAMDAAARSAPAPGRADVAKQLADAGEPQVLSALTLVEPEDDASPISTSALGAETAAPAKDALDTRSHRLPVDIEELSDRGRLMTRLAAATIEAEPATSLPAIVIAARPMQNITAVDVDPEPVAEARAPRRHVSPKPRHLKARSPATSAVSTPAKTAAANKYAKVPRWAEKMFEAPWQTKAFAFQ